MPSPDLLAKVARIAERGKDGDLTADDPAPLPAGTTPIDKPTGGYVDILLSADYHLIGVVDANGNRLEGFGHQFANEDGTITWRIPQAESLGAPVGRAKAHRSAGANERRAAELARPTIGTDIFKCLKAFANAYEAGHDGLTDDELGQAIGKPRTTAGPRRKNLEEQGWVRKTGQTRPSGTGGRSEIHTLTQAGARELRLTRGDTNA